MTLLEARQDAAPAPQGRRWPVGALGLLPALAVLAIWLVWIPRDGGYYPREWYPGAVLLVLVGGVMALSGWGRLPGRAGRVALGLLAAWIAWSFASMLWAGSPGSAWESANELLLVLATGAVLAATPWSARSAATFLGLTAAGIGVFAGLDLLHATQAASLRDVLLADRYLGPVGYPNGTAALAVMAFWIALLLSARPHTPPVLRPLLLGLAVFCLLYSLLPQSRAAIGGLGVVAVLVLAVGPHRVRVLVRLAASAGAAVLAAPAIFDVYTVSVEGGAIGTAIDRAARAIVVAGLAAVALGAVLALIEDRVRLGERAQRGLRVAAVAAVAVALAGGAGAALAERDRISDSVSERWEIFKDGEDMVRSGPRFGTAIRDQRYDYWRVALEVFRERPVAGGGAGNFEHLYLARRRVDKPSRYAHSLWLRALSETGIVGLGLLAGAFGALVAGLVGVRRRGDPALRIPATIALAVLVGFGLHASFDWIEEIPVAFGAAVGLPLLVLGAGGARRFRRGRVAVAGGAVLALVALVPAWLSVEYAERASGRPVRAALADLDRAQALNPLAVRPHFTEGTIALNAGLRGRARAAFEDALEVEDHWFPHFQLGLLAAEAGSFESAARELRIAARLDATDPLVAEAIARVRRRERIDPVAFNRLALEQPVFQHQPN